MMMPRMDGLTLAREIKAQADLPIIVLSAIDAGDSKADLLEEVAEDYVTKPYHYPELRARINRVLRRLGDKVPRQSLVLGPNLTLDLHRREATVAGQIVQLTPTESRLLYALAANLGQTVTTETLLARGWAETEDADPSYVWVTMRRLRQKVELDPNKPVHLMTVRGIGYRLVLGGDRDAASPADRRPPRDASTGAPAARAPATPPQAGRPSGDTGSVARSSRLLRALIVVLVAAAVDPAAAFGRSSVAQRRTDSSLLGCSLFVDRRGRPASSSPISSRPTSPRRCGRSRRPSSGRRAATCRTPIKVAGEDELARLAESHNRLAADLAAPQPRARPDPAAIDAGLAAATASTSSSTGPAPRRRGRST